jgi:hypothetical protein
MASKFSSGKFAIAQCDRCGFRFKLKQLKRLVIKTKDVNILVCQDCWEPDQPQLQLGMYPVNDPQAVRNPRPDIGYFEAGLNGLQLTETTGPSTNATGVPTQGNRIIQWGWNPVGLYNPLGLEIPDNLVASSVLGDVTVTIT